MRQNSSDIRAARFGGGLGVVLDIGLDVTGAYYNGRRCIASGQGYHISFWGGPMQGGNVGWGAGSYFLEKVGKNFWVWMGVFIYGANR